MKRMDKKRNLQTKISPGRIQPGNGWKPRQKLISKGYEPPIHNFSITTSAGTDITNEILTDTGYIFLFIIPDIGKASDKGLIKINDLALRCRELGIKALALTASTNSQVDRLQNTISTGL